MDINKVAAASRIKGLGYVRSGSTTLSIPSFGLGAGATQSFSTTLEAPVQDAASLTRVKFTGVGNTDVNNQYLYFRGALSFRQSGPGYDVGAIIERIAAGQRFTVQIYNSTGAGITVPTISALVESYFYTAPWR